MGIVKPRDNRPERVNTDATLIIKINNIRSLFTHAKIKLYFEYQKMYIIARHKNNYDQNLNQIYAIINLKKLNVTSYLSLPLF